MSTLVLVVKKVHMALFALKNWLLHVSCQLSHQSQCFQLGKQRHPNPVQQFQCPLLLWEERGVTKTCHHMPPRHLRAPHHEIVYGAPSDVAGDARQLDIIAICADCQMIV